MATTTNNPHHVGNPSLEFHPNGEGQMIIRPKDLNIVWGGDSRYWTLPDDDQESWGGAELNQVYWLEVTGCVDKTNPEKQYEVGFHVSFTADAFGWGGGGSPLYVMVKRGKDGKFVWQKFVLDPAANQESYDITGKSIIINPPAPADAQDSSINNKQQLADSKLYFGLYEVWSGKWKGGLKIHHAFIRELPSHDIINTTSTTTDA